MAQDARSSGFPRQAMRSSSQTKLGWSDSQPRRGLDNDRLDLHSRVPRKPSLLPSSTTMSWRRERLRDIDLANTPLIRCFYARSTAFPKPRAQVRFLSGASPPKVRPFRGHDDFRRHLVLRSAALSRSRACRLRQRMRGKPPWGNFRPSWLLPCLASSAPPEVAVKDAPKAPPAHAVHDLVRFLNRVRRFNSCRALPNPCPYGFSRNGGYSSVTRMNA
jgi:hypothetical protein